MSLLGELEPVLPESQSLLGNLEPVPLYQPKTAEGALESVQAGLQGSVLGLAWRGRLPDLVSDPSHSAWWERALTGISQVGADLPIMIPAGGLGVAGGTAAGTPAGPAGMAVGGVLGGGAAMFGVPAAMRETLMQAYKSGEIVTAADFWNSIKEVASHTGKEAAIGAATMGAGSIAARTVGKALVPSIGTSIGVGTATKVIGAADVTAQIAAMTGIPAGLQGRLPDMQEVMDAAIVIGGLKGAHLAVDKVMKVYEKTGRTPAQQAADAKESPEVAEEFTKETPQEKEWIQNPLKIQEGLFREVARIDELAKKPIESMTETEKVELSASRDRAAELEVKLVKANEFKASSDKVYDDFYRQLKEVDQTRQDSGTDPFGDEHNQSVARLVSDNAKAIASLAGILPEQVYSDRGATIQDASAAYRAKVEAEIPPEAPRFTPPVQLKDAEVDMFGDPIQPRVAVKDLPTEEIPIENLKLSKEVPQFKQGANDEGIVEPLGGKFDRTGVAPIQVWERLDGSQEIISGRHRFDLARRSNEATIPSQVHRESEGFTAKDAAMLDAELNIREGQGSVADYAQHIKAAGYSRETADERGLLARAKGKAGFAIANNGSDTLIANHRSGLLSDEAALSISLAAPNVERLQSLGIQMVQSGKSILMAVNTMKSVSVMAAERAAGGEQGDIFGFDDSAMREAESMAKKAVSIQRGISEQIAAVSGASKRPELAKKLGVNVENPEGIRERIAELRQEQYLWDNWPMHPELVSKLRELHQDVTPFELVPETPAELEARNKEAVEQAKRALLDDKIKDRIAKGKPVTIDQADLFNTQNTLFQDSVQSIDGLPGTPANRTIDADTLRDLRREAAGLEKPKSGTLLYISQDGEAVASGEKGTKIPTRFIEFAEKHGLKFIARRGTGGNVSRKSNTPMPVEYRESGARYFGDEVQEVLPTKPNQFIDRTGKTLFQDGVSPAPTDRKWYYSQLSESIGKMPEKLNGEESAKWLKANAGKHGVKADEIKWSGILDYLQMQGKNKVSKEQVQDFLLNNNVQVNDVVLGAHGKASEQMRRALTGENLTELNLTSDDWLKHSEMFEKTAQSWQRAGEDDKAERYFALSEEANRLAEGLDSETGSTEGMPKFASYQLPGGTGYKELLITLPQREESPYVVETKSGEEVSRHSNRATALEAYKAMPDPLLHQIRPVRDSKEFQSSHFEQKNILAHIRMNERVDADGARVLFLEEIQSDFAQKGRKEGFANEPLKGKVVPQDLAGKTYWKIEWENGNFSGGYNTKENAERALAERAIPMAGGVPSAPFVTDTKAWTSLALKRAIAYAVENGFQKISWTTGEQQAARYDLSKQVSRVEVSRPQNGTFAVYAYKEKSDTVPVMQTKASSESELADIIGKELASKIVKQPIGTKRDYTGLDLKVGGEGMKGYYDGILPQVAKKLGAEVGEVTINQDHDANLNTEKEWNEGSARDVLKRGGEIYVTDAHGMETRIKNEATLDAEIEENGEPRGYILGDTQGSSTQPGFTITDAMREQVQGKGLPLFQKQAQESANDHLASYNVAEKLITTFQGANKSSVIHELGHHFLETLKHYATLPDATPEIKAQWDIARREFAIGETGDISTASHEQMARTWERYLAEGKAPTPELQGIFSKFKTWMLEIYSDIRNLGIEITPEIRGFFDRLLATEEEIQYANQNNIPKAYAREAMANDAQKIVPDEQKPGFKDEQLAIEPFAEELQKGPGSGLTNDSRINAQFINGTTDLKLAIQRVSEIDQANIQKHRGGTNGVKSWEEANSEADKFIEDTLGGKLVDSEPSSIPHDIRQRAAFKVMMSVAKYSLQLRDTILKKGENATVQDQFDYLNSILRMRMTHAEYLGLRAASARAMNQIRDMSPDSGVVDKMVEMTSERNLYQSAKTDAQVASELRLKLNEIMTQHFGGKSALDIAKLQEDIKSLKGQLVFSKAVTDATKWEMVVEGWKSGLLSGPVTHITNLFGTGAFQALRIPVDALASVIGMARGASVGMGESDRASMSESVARVSGMLGGIQDALRVGWSEFKADDPTGKTETFRTAIPGKVGEIVRTPLRAMAAEDAILNTMYSRGELHTLAIRQAFNDGMNPSTKEFADRVQSLIDNPTPEMQAEVDSTATRMTFNMPSGEKTAALQGFIKKWNLQLIIPFVRTPINIFEEAARLSPFAPIVKDWRADISKGGATRDKALAEIVLGSTIMGLTAAYAMSGSISGAGSPDQGKNRAKAGVWQPYSVLIGDTWYEYSRIQPVGTLVGLAADMAGVWEHMTDEEMDKIPKMLSIAFANAVTNQTFLQGITNVVNAMSDPKRFAPKFMQQLAASFVPNIVGQPTAMSDPVVREVNSMLEAVQARIPGLRQDLLPKRDWLGEEVQTKERLGIVSPVREQDVSNDPVRLEAARLDISISASPKKIHLGKGTGKVGDVELTPEERDKFEQVSGEMTHKILTNVIGQAGWENIPDPIKRNIFHKIITSGNKYAAAITLPPEKRAALIGQINEKIIDSLSMEPAQ